MVDILEVQKKCIEEYEKGKTQLQVSYDLGLEAIVVSFLLNCADVKKNKFKRHKKEKIKLPVNKIKRLYVEEKLCIEKIAKMFNVSKTTIRSRLVEMGIELRNKNNYKRRNDYE